MRNHCPQDAPMRQHLPPGKSISDAGSPLIKVLWILTHLSVWVLEHVLHLALRIRKELHNLYHRYQGRPPLGSKQHFAFTKTKLRELNKLPTHVVVMLGPEQPDYGALARFVSWSLAAGIDHISFYDHQGILKRNHECIYRHVTDMQRSDSETIVWVPHIREAGGTLPPRNGYLHRAVVSFFSPEDGKQELAALGRTIGAAVRDGNLQLSDVTVELVDRRQQAHFYNIPDPELALYFGSTCCTYGMLPWQIRLTEFLPLNVSLAGVQAADFIDCLQQYAKCEQRFGK